MKPAKKKLLIVRSASFQQLDSNFAFLTARFPDREIHLLTHEHGRKLAEKYAGVAKVAVYPGTGHFKAGVKVEGVTPGFYDEVVVVVSNLSGAGFSNVFAFGQSLGGGALYRMNLVGEIEEITVPAFRRMKRLDLAASLFSATFGTLLGLLAVGWFVVSLPLLTFGKGGNSR